jgi:hypothetical protein
MNTNTQVQDIEVSINELKQVIIEEVENKPRVPFVNLTYISPFNNWVKKCKEDGSINPYWKEVTKETKKTYLPVVNYKGRNDGNRIKEGIEGEHELGVLKGKKHISKCLLTDLETETKLYIMVEQFQEIKPSKTIYRHNGNEIDKGLFEKWITFYDNYSGQEQDRKVEVLTLLLDRMERITINGQGYKIRK